MKCFYRKLWLAIFVLLTQTASLFAQVVWDSLDTGLSLAEIHSPVTSEYGTNIITILKIDPVQYEFVMVNASAEDSVKRTVVGWCKQKNLLGAVNGGMFRLTDNLTNTGFMRNFNHVNNSALSAANYKLVLALNPKNNTVPLMQIIDLECEDWNKLKIQYNTYAQGLRVINCRSEVAWRKSIKKWSMVLWGIDGEGNALWIFTRSPLEVEVFAGLLLKLNIGIKRVMYLEGGPEGSLFLNHPNKKLLLMGSYETGFNENDHNEVFWDVPNVIGIRKR